jgi:predicted RNA-binding protein
LVAHEKSAKTLYIIKTEKKKCSMANNTFPFPPKGRKVKINKEPCKRQTFIID